MKKQTTDAGLEYLKRLGIRAAKDRNSIVRDMEGAYGKKEVDAFFKEFDALCKKGDRKSYDVKNADYDRSIFFTGSYDGDIIRRCCNWIEENKTFFGKKILDVGCDCGFMTCFIAKTFPEAEITSIDRCANGVAVAKKLSEYLGITNITFINTELSDLDEGDFDTVFSMRTMMENGDCIEDINNDFFVQTDEFKKTLENFGNLLAAKVKAGGKLITIENTGRDPLLAGWIEALYGAGFNGSIDNYDEVICKELGKEVDYQALVFSKEKADNNPKDLFEEIFDSANFGLEDNLRHWDAKFMYESKKGEMLKGYSVTGPGATTGSIFTLWSVKDDPDKFIFFQTHEGEPILQIYSKSKVHEVEETIDGWVEDAKKYSMLKVEKL